MSDHAEVSGATAVADSRTRAGTPWWYYFVVGAIAAAAVIVMLLAPGIPGGLAVLVLVIANPLLEALRRRLSGEPPPAFRSPAFPYTVAGIVLVLGSMALGWYLVLSLGITWAAWPIGGAVFAVILVGGWLGDRAALRSSTANR
ncbi:hypothetical protein [Agromyces silvae]|uniref:hypothetical protein n=1 Tax=Agromyces silvae TaxID=3388266 RepID=UPI00280B1042|nr:hypothetical protein [Agromyces protaetiae]